MHVFIKLTSTVTLVMAPLFVAQTTSSETGDVVVQVGTTETLFVIALMVGLGAYFAGLFDRCVGGGRSASKNTTVDDKPTI